MRRPITVRIHLDGQYWLLADELQWILAIKQKSGRFEHKAFFGELELLLQEFVLRRLRTSKANSIKELLDNHKMITTALCEVLQPLQIKVVSCNDATNLYLLNKSKVEVKADKQNIA